MNYERLNKLRMSDVKYKKLIEKLSKMTEKKIKKLFLDAVKNCDVDTATFLFANVANKDVLINCTNKNGVTPLMIACLKQDLGMAKFLLAEGADPNARDERGFDLTISHEDDSIVVRKFWNSNLNFDGEEHFWHRQGGLSALMYCLCGEPVNIEVVKELVKRGANVNAKDAENFTALMFAVERGNLEATKLLIKCGANVNDQDIYGNSILLHAISKMYVKEIVPILVFAGANPNIKNMFGKDCYNAKTANEIGKREIDESIKLKNIATLLKDNKKQNIKRIEQKKEEEISNCFEEANNNVERIMA